MDDYWLIELGNILISYKGYSDLRPHTQVQFLTLLDKLGVPHEKGKPFFGQVVPVIGFKVDTRVMTIRMSEEHRERLATALLTFIDDPKRKHSLRRWQSVLGWTNWALNARPHACPALALFYRKIAGKSIPLASIYANAKVKPDLTWFAKHLRSRNGLTLIRGNCWDVSEADVTIYCDACPAGMGFWPPSHGKAFFFRCPPEFDRNSDFCEAATIVSALQWALWLEVSLNLRVLIYSDNLATVEVFSSMRGNLPYYHMTMQAAAWIHNHVILWRILHVPGLDNQIADYLSQGTLDRVQTLSPLLQTADFIPLPNVYPGLTGV